MAYRLRGDKVADKVCGLDALVPKLLDCQCGEKRERLLSVLGEISRPDGFNLDEFSALRGFELKRSRSKFRFPPKPAFEYLGSSQSDSFVLGMKKTEMDIKGGISHCYYINYDGGSIPSNDISAWASFQLKPEKLMVNCIQSETVLDFDKSGVEKEMLERADYLEGRQTGTVKDRIRSLRKNNVPWAYPDRALLFGVVSVWIAEGVGVNEVKFVEDGMSNLCKRTYEYTRDCVRHQGMRIGVGMSEIF